MGGDLLADLTSWHAGVVLLAALWAGTINAVVGSGTLVTFPVLVALGVPPVSATTSNAVGLVAGGVSGTWGYRRELRGQGSRIARFLPLSVLGALTGSSLLLTLPPGAFELVVPGLVVLALSLVLLQPRLQALAARRAAAAPAPAGRPAGGTGRATQVVLLVATYLIGVYGGYFTAAQGVLVLGVHGTLLLEPIQRVNALKNLLTLAVNVVAAATYLTVGRDRLVWWVVLVVAAGSLVGGAIGSSAGRRLPAPVLRGTVVVLGVVALAVLVLR